MDEIESLDSFFKCAHCGEGMAVPQSVDVYALHSSGGKVVKSLHVNVKLHEYSATVDHDMVENPSHKGDGVNINLICESCENISTISVYQRKCETLITYGKQD